MHQGSRRLAERARTVFPSGVTHDIRAFAPWPIYVERAAGGRKWDVDGNEYVDYIGGHGSLLLGHNRPEVVEAVQQALTRGTHFGSSHEGELEWGEQVLQDGAVRRARALHLVGHRGDDDGAAAGARLHRP